MRPLDKFRLFHAGKINCHSVTSFNFGNKLRECGKQNALPEFPVYSVHPNYVRVFGY